MADKKPTDSSGESNPADLSPTTILTVLHGLVPAKRKAWLESHWASLTPDAKATIVWGQDTAYFGEDAGMGKFLDEHKGEASGGKVNSTDLGEAATTRVDAALGGAPISGDLDGDGTVRPDEKAAVDKATKDAADKQTSATGVDAGKAATDKVNASLDPYGIPNDGGLPDWVRSQFGGIPTGTQISEMKTEWNATHPSEQINSAADLWGKLQAASPDHQELVNATIDGRDPIVQQIYGVTSSVRLPGSTSPDGGYNDIRTGNINGGTHSTTVPAKDVAINQDAFKIANGMWGADQRGLGEIVRAAARAGLTTPDGQSVGWQPLASLYKMTSEKDKKQASDGGYEAIRTGNLTASTAQSTAMSKATTLAQLAFKYKEGLRIYSNDATLAALYASGHKGLVDKMVMSPYGYLDAVDQATAQQVLLSGGWDTKQLLAAGYATASPWFDNIVNSSANAYGGLGNSRLEEEAARAKSAARQNYITTNKADPETIKQDVVDLWQQLFDAKPSDKQIAVVAGKINALVESRAAAAGLQDQNTTNVATDVNAEVRAAAEASPDYKRFYGHKPTGMSDAEYHGQFVNAGQSLLGGQAADPQAIRGGLATGDYQTTIGAVAGSSQAWNNSSFMSRMAQAAISINGAT